MQDYFNEVNTLIEELEVNKKVREYKNNSETLRTYWSVGKLIIEAQGDKRAKYGTNFIQEWGEKLKTTYGTFYDIRNLQRMRQFYLVFPKAVPVGPLSWKHFRYITY